MITINPAPAFSSSQHQCQRKHTKSHCGRDMSESEISHRQTATCRAACCGRRRCRRRRRRRCVPERRRRESADLPDATHKRRQVSGVEQIGLVCSLETMVLSAQRIPLHMDEEAYQFTHCGKADWKVSVHAHLITSMTAPGLKITWIRRLSIVYTEREPFVAHICEVGQYWRCICAAVDIGPVLLADWARFGCAGKVRSSVGSDIQPWLSTSNLLRRDPESIN